MEIAPFQPVDMISDLPDDVIEIVLMCLTMRDAAKTSILSKQWRYKWVKLPQLIFDDTLLQKSERNLELARMKFVGILYQVLLLHQGPITKSSLIIPNLRGGSEIDHLIYILWKNGVEEFTLKIKNMEEYKLPSSLFMCLHLKHLNLSCCLISLPPSFKGFNKLIRLELHDVTIDPEVLGSLISSSPLLEHLVLHVPIGVDSLKIDAPRLKLFELECYPTHVCFKKSPFLAIVSETSGIDLYEDEVIMEDGNCKFVEFFDSLPALQQLCIDSYFMKILAAGQLQTRLPVSLIHLKILKLFEICLDSPDDLSYVLCLIRSSPNLQKLNLEILDRAIADSSPVLEFLEVQDYSDVFLNQLQKVKLEYISGTVPEMTLIKLLLEKSPKLHRMVIWPIVICDERLGILEELNKFGRASPNVKIIFKA
ncbi:F-box/fbd/LRR-repeat protein [Abeliophyllum distichum]|uniref:F-box/fbd/LRR-repeat protein n=1 Tax=Abeliophyllum distichum TaxID=126358 RepID=A0ABD1V2K6_9LAMI